MRVFVTGATGFVGSAVVRELISAGHRALGLARSESAAAALIAAGAEVERGSLEDHACLARAASASDGVIHTAFIHDFANIAASGAIDRAAIEVLGAALAGSDRPFVVTSAIGLLAGGKLATEEDLPDPNAAGAYRAASEQAARALAERGVRVSIVRLPPSVHGEGDYGFVPGLIRSARAAGSSAYIADGQNRWSALHRLDAARLYRLALERAPAGATLHGTADEGVPTGAISEAIGRQLSLPVTSKSGAEAEAHFGWLAKFFARDMAASSARTRALLDWQPREPDLLADLDVGHYFAT